MPDAVAKLKARGPGGIRVSSDSMRKTRTFIRRTVFLARMRNRTTLRNRMCK